MKITHLVLWVQDNTISQRFYKKLGFEIRKSDDKHTIVSLENFELYLVSMRDEDEFAGDALHSEKGKGMYVYINVSDVDATYKSLIAKGFTPRSEPRDWEWGNREFVLKDPDGYKLCFWQPTRD